MNILNSEGSKSPSKRCGHCCETKLLSPKWADLEAIEAVYKRRLEVEAETGIPHAVDHIVPLQSDLVCGLHVAANLQVIPRLENTLKHNRWLV